MRTAERQRRRTFADDAKFVPARVREGLVPRPDLVHRLRATSRSTVTLVVAPGGYGKSTLLTELSRAAGSRPFVWITAEESDNDPLVFARCITTAVERSGAVDSRTLRAGTRSSDSHAVVLARLVKALKMGKPLAIAIDDLHLVTSLRSLKIVETIANNLPPQSQLLLASRMRPRLNLTTLRAAGRLIELESEDLRLSVEEGLQLLRRAGADATAAEAADITARTDGWPAGLYFAALACTAHGQPLSGFDGADRFAADYFDAEYLDSLDADDRAFLLLASVLDQPSGLVCDTVLDASGSATRLDRLTRSNLFVTGIGSGKTRRYRMHPTFREALSAELRRREPGRIEEIARRAADWCEARGDLQGTAEYGWQAGDRERFAEVAEQAMLQLFQSGHLPVVDRWLRRLDIELLERHRALAVCGAFVHALCGRPEEAEAWAAHAEGTPPDLVMPDATPSPEPWVAALRATLCRLGKDQMRHDAAQALAGLAEGSPLRPTSLMLLGIGQLLAGEAGAADELLAEAHMAARTSYCPATAAAASAVRSLLAAAEGRWESAESLATSARDVVQEEGLDAFPTSAMAYVAGARCAVQRSDWVRARNDLERVRDCLPPRGPGWLTALVYVEAARAHLALAEREAASDALADAEMVLERSADLGPLDAQVSELRAALRPQARSRGDRTQLTRAELRLLPLLTTHLTFREIGELLGISRNTVKTQAICTYRKLGVRSRSEAIGRAVEIGLVDPPEALDVSPDSHGAASYRFAQQG
jgi:LuxR family maltose regulon positive regulatory protein